LAAIPTTQRTAFSWEHSDQYFFASEIALQQMLDEGKATSLDEILSDPFLVEEFDKIAQSFAPGYTPLEYRWSALQIRKQAKLARSRGASLVPPKHLGAVSGIDELDLGRVPPGPGVYLLRGDPDMLYVGETLDLHKRLASQFGDGQKPLWSQFSPILSLQFFRTETLPTEMLSWQSCLVEKFKPSLNFRELRSAT
jgi:site-specific DNA-methyltransferase (adenine-specific)